jgi:hypothetical protein
MLAMNADGTCAGLPAVHAGGGVLPSNVLCLTMSSAVMNAVAGNLA